MGAPVYCQRCSPLLGNSPRCPAKRGRQGTRGKQDCPVTSSSCSRCARRTARPMERSALLHAPHYAGSSRSPAVLPDVALDGGTPVTVVSGARTRSDQERRSEEP